MGWSDDDEFGWIVFFVSSWHHDRWWNQISITINSMSTGGLGVNGAGTRVTVYIDAGTGTASISARVDNVVTFGATGIVGAPALITFVDADDYAVAGTAGTTNYDFSSTTKVVGAGATAAEKLR